MSQEKVEKKKELKRNRKKIVKKEHRMAKLGAVIAVIAAVFVAGWLVYSIHNKVVAYQEDHPKTVKVDLSAISEFYGNMSSTEDSGS